MQNNKKKRYRVEGCFVIVGNKKKYKTSNSMKIMASSTFMIHLRFLAREDVRLTPQVLCIQKTRNCGHRRKRTETWSQAVHAHVSIYHLRGATSFPKILSLPMYLCSESRFEKTNKQKNPLRIILFSEREKPKYFVRYKGKINAMTKHQSIINLQESPKNVKTFSFSVI